MISPLPLPSWLQSNPAAPVQAFLSGAQVGTSQRGQDIAARGQELSADARAEALDEQRRQFNERQAEEARAREDAAKQAAIQFQGVQEYHQLVADGVPESKALMQAGAKMFYRKPEALLTALNRQEANEIDRQDMLRKIVAESEKDKPLKLEMEEVVPGVKVLKGGGRWQLMDEKNALLSPGATFSLLARYDKQAGDMGVAPSERKKAKESADFFREYIGKNWPEMALPGMTVPRGTNAPAPEAFSAPQVLSAPQPAVIVIQRKSDGAKFRYRGNPNDVPLDKYEILAPEER